MRQPDVYTKTELGNIYPWPEGLDVNTFNLDSHICAPYLEVPQEGKIHAIIWNPNGLDGVGGRWDSINGWTDKLKPVSVTERLALAKPMEKVPVTEEEMEELYNSKGGVDINTKLVSDGSTASYYKLPPEATELQDLISYRNMNLAIGEIFHSCYRYGLVSHSNKLRDAKKIKFYIEAEIERLEKYEDGI